MRVLVTGGSGTIGGYVLRELFSAGHAVASFSRNPPLVEGAEFIRGDITDLGSVMDACRGQDAIVHLAAVPGPGRAPPEQLLHTNVMGTVHVLESAVRTGVSKVVFASSGAATGFSFQSREIVPRYLPIDEEHPCEPQDEYGLSKLLGELICKRYSAAHDLQTLCLRLNHNWYLSRKEAGVAVRAGWAKGLTVEQLWKERYVKVLRDSGEWPVPGPPRPKNLLWAVTDARDAAQAVRRAVENSEIRHEVFLINGGDTCSTVETPELIAKHYPDVPLKSPLDGYASLVSHQKATRMLGYRPQCTWREGDFATWMETVR